MGNIKFPYYPDTTGPHQQDWTYYPGVSKPLVLEKVHYYETAKEMELTKKIFALQEELKMSEKKSKEQLEAFRKGVNEMFDKMRSDIDAMLEKSGIKDEELRRRSKTLGKVKVLATLEEVCDKLHELVEVNTKEEYVDDRFDGSRSVYNLIVKGFNNLGTAKDKINGEKAAYWDKEDEDAR